MTAAERQAFAVYQQLYLLRCLYIIRFYQYAKAYGLRNSLEKEAGTDTGLLGEIAPIEKDPTGHKSYREVYNSIKSNRGQEAADAQKEKWEKESGDFSREKTKEMVEMHVKNGELHSRLSPEAWDDWESRRHEAFEKFMDMDPHKDGVSNDPNALYDPKSTTTAGLISIHEGGSSKPRPANEGQIIGHVVSPGKLLEQNGEVLVLPGQGANANTAAFWRQGPYDEFKMMLDKKKYDKEYKVEFDSDTRFFGVNDPSRGFNINQDRYNFLPLPEKKDFKVENEGRDMQIRGRLKEYK